MRLSWPAFTLMVLSSLCIAHVIGAQGAAGAAVSGSVLLSPGRPAERATVRLRNLASGAVREARADDHGRFLFEAVAPGGPYRVEAVAPGQGPISSAADFSLALGERVAVILAFAPDAAQPLAAVVVRARPLAEDPGGAGGPAFSLPNALVHGLPLLDRDFVALFATIPQALGRTSSSFGGQSPVLNAIQVDGGTASDVYGVGRTPGSSAGAKSISLEALDEIKVLIAPFDVRQSMFTGALINAITRSGSNEWRADAFASLQRPDLVGPDTAGARVNHFQFLQYGATAGGPLLRDRLHVFVAADLQESRAPYVGPVTADPATGISDATAARAAAIFRDTYGLNAGTAEAPVLANPDQSVFAKVTYAISPHHSAAFWHEESRAHIDAFNRTVRNRQNQAGWQLSGSGSTAGTSVVSNRLHLESEFGSVSNELVAGTQSSNDVRDSWLPTPLFLVQADVANTFLSAGGERNSEGTTLGQQVREVTDNVTWLSGAHAFTAGAHAEWFAVTDRLFQNSWGVWLFPSVDALAAKAPTRYEIAIPLRPGGPTGQFHAAEYAAYVQDRWVLPHGLSVTGGVRVDVPFNAAPETNRTLADDAALGNINTAAFPSGNAILSPRLLATWLIDEQTSTRLRAGAGVFTARPPFAWFGNAFINTGLDQATLICTLADGVPAPVVDPSSAPQRCTHTAPQAPPPSAVTTFSPAFRFPRVGKLLAGIDRELGAAWSLSADAIYSRGIDAPYLVDVNLRQVETNAEGRAMYGTISANASHPTRRDSTAFAQVLRYGNHGGDWSTALSFTASGHWGNGGRIQAGYQWSRARDAMSVTNPGSVLAYQNAPIDGSLDDRRVTTSAFDAPHSLTVIGLAPVVGGVTIASIFRAQSGRPFSYVSTGDANADGVASNDLSYIPRTAADISLSNPEQYAALDRFIESEPCLRAQRGRIVARNSCRNPAFVSLDARVSKSLAVSTTRPMELSLDVFNLPNLLNGQWGLVRETTSRQQYELLTVAGWDQVADRPRYTIPTSGAMVVLPARGQVVLTDSRWRMQAGVRLRL